MASTINEIADQCVYRVALGPLWAGVRRTRRRFASHLCPGPVEAGLARQIWPGRAAVAHPAGTNSTPARAGTVQNYAQNTLLLQQNRR